MYQYGREDNNDMHMDSGDSNETVFFFLKRYMDGYKWIKCRQASRGDLYRMRSVEDRWPLETRSGQVWASAPEAIREVEASDVDVVVRKRGLVGSTRFWLLKVNTTGNSDDVSLQPGRVASDPTDRCTRPVCCGRARIESGAKIIIIMIVVVVIIA